MNKKILLILFFVFTTYIFISHAGQSESWMITGNNVNMRQGIGLEFDVIKILNKNEKVNVISTIDQWCIVQTSDKLVGVVNSNYIKKVSTNTDNLSSTNKTNSILTNDEKELLNHINKEREKQKLNLLSIDEKLVEVARLKANDMIKNNYFGHTSKVYGSHFEMIKKYNIKNKVSGENIAGNRTAKDAFDAFIKSSKDKKNIVNKNYNYIGVGIVDSSKYGKMIVLEFVGR